MKNKIVKTKLTEREIKLYLSGDKTYRAGGTLKGNQVNSVRGSELFFINHGSYNITTLASSFLSIMCGASCSLDFFSQICVAL